MRDQSHLEQIERWANFVRENPTKWKKIHTEFINTLFEKNTQFIEKILKTPRGKEKLVELYDINNKKGYSWLE